MTNTSLEFASKAGFLRITAELLLAFALVTVAYLAAVEPLLQSVAPDVYAQSGLHYSRTNLPNTPTELTHLLLSIALLGPFFYWRLVHTATGQRLAEAVAEGHE